MDKLAKNEGGIEHATASDIGMRRTNNQDSFAVSFSKSEKDWQRRGHFFMVADGMGAHAAGELASKMAVDGVSHRYRKYAELAPHLALERALRETNAEVHRRGTANLDFRNMGTTASAMAILPQGAIVAHVGDSRVYRVRGNDIEQLTFDHSVVWELEASGRFGAGKGGAGVPKNWITRSLGPNAEVEVDLEGPFPLQVNDTFVLCSDGLSGQLTDEEIGVIVSQLPPEEAAEALVDIANLRGGPDNVTVSVVRIADASLAEASRTAAPLSDVVAAPTRINPAVWIVGVVMTAIGALTAVFLQPAVGVIVATLGALLLLGAAFRALSAPSAETTGVLGKGPYRRYQCPASDDSVEMLQSIVHELRDAAESESWTIDWAKLEQFLENASKARKTGDVATAFQHLARSVSFLMQELRSQEDRESSDSAVDY